MHTRLIGRVVRGSGNATAWVITARFEVALGVKLHPGTLNVLFPDPKDEHPFFHQDLAPQSIEAAGAVRFCRCTVNGAQAFIVGTWEGQSNRPPMRHPGHVLFEISAVNRMPGLDYDTQNVVVEYDPDTLVRVPFKE